jgi:threonine synthase
MGSVTFIPEDLEKAKIAASVVYGGNVVGVRGNYDAVNRLCAQLVATKPWAFVNVNLRSFYSEGSKTIAFEIAEQLGWRSPEAVVLPIGSGSLFVKVAKGFKELGSVGLTSGDEPALFGAQPSGCAPVARAFEAGADDVLPVKPETVAKSLAIGDPADGIYCLDRARSTGGSITEISEQAVIDGIELLARTEGIFTETAGGVTISGLERLVREGAIDRDQETVAVVTGSGLKTFEQLQHVDVSHVIDPTTESLEELSLKEVGG